MEHNGWRIWEAGLGHLVFDLFVIPDSSRRVIFFRGCNYTIYTDIFNLSLNNTACVEGR